MGRYDLRCKQCLRVVRYPSTSSKKIQMCGVCRQNEMDGENILVLIRNRGDNHN